MMKLSAITAAVLVGLEVEDSFAFVPSQPSPPSGRMCARRKSCPGRLQFQSLPETVTEKSSYVAIDDFAVNFPALDHVFKDRSAEVGEIMNEAAARFDPTSKEGNLGNKLLIQRSVLVEGPLNEHLRVKMDMHALSSIFDTAHSPEANHLYTEKFIESTTGVLQAAAVLNKQSEDLATKHNTSNKSVTEETVDPFEDEDEDYLEYENFAFAMDNFAFAMDRFEDEDEDYLGDENFVFAMACQSAALSDAMKVNTSPKKKTGENVSEIKPFRAVYEEIEEYNDDHFHPFNDRFLYSGSFGVAAAQA